MSGDDAVHPDVTAARSREREAWEARFKHVNAANNWLAVADGDPARYEMYEVLSKWMAAYATADAEAELAFAAIADRLERGAP